MIKVFHQISDFNAARNLYENKSIGLVPTMGNLHNGHLSLLEESLKKNDLSIVTIFVNPTQFGPNEDFESYPRTLEQDLKLIEDFNKDKKEIWVLAPENPKDIYPENFATKILVAGELTNKWCGPLRPGHFEGVATVVYLLFQHTKPQRAYFGQKDFQQTLVIKRMTTDLMLPVDIIVLPIIREDSGLALSSRNQYLSNEQKNDALHLFSSLKRLEDILEQGNWTQAVEEARQIMNNDSRFDYLEVLDANRLTPPDNDTQTFVIAGVLVIGKTRLLDNLIWEKNRK